MSSVRPSRPRNVGGLPSGPRARSVGRDVQRDSDTNASVYSSRPVQPPTSYPRQIRPQRSLANLPPRSHLSTYSERPATRPPPLPTYEGSVREMNRDPRTPSRYGRADSAYGRRSQDSSSQASSPVSETSSGSSFLDRMKTRSGETSSVTSVEDEPEPPKKGRGGWLRERVAAQEERPMSPQDGNASDMSDPAAGHGASLWGRVAGAASNLTVTVSQAWTNNIQTHSGEQTPLGQESRLTRAMKAYHLEKAKDPSDLPAWLFDEHERRAAGGRPSTSRRSDRGDEYSQAEVAPPAQRSRGLRDIYDSVAASSNPSARSETRGPPSRHPDAVNENGSSTSRAGDRLKALRDAKRIAAQRNTSATASRDDDADPTMYRGRENRDGPTRMERGRDTDERSQATSARRPPPRMGLPARPGRGAQRF